MENKTITMLKEYGIPFIEYHHEPVLNYETAHKVDLELHLTGTEAKALYIRGKKTGNYYVFVTKEGIKLDAKYVKRLIGEQISIVSSDELTRLTGQEAGCVSPFGYDDKVIYIVDEAVYKEKGLLYAPGVATMTFEISGENLKKMIDKLPNKKYVYDSEHVEE